MDIQFDFKPFIWSVVILFVLAVGGWWWGSGRYDKGYQQGVIDYHKGKVTIEQVVDTNEMIIIHEN